MHETFLLKKEDTLVRINYSVKRIDKPNNQLTCILRLTGL